MKNLTEQYNIININNEWYFDTINEVHIHLDGIESYKQLFNN